MDSSLTVLLVEDNAAEARLLEGQLADLPPGHPIALVWVETVAAAAEQFSQKTFDAMLLDLSLPDSIGLETVDKANELAPHIPVIVLTNLNDERMAIESLRRGAQDYLIKGRTDGRLLVRALRYAIERKQAEERRRELVQERERLMDENQRQRQFMENLIHVAPIDIAVFRGDEFRLELANPHYRRTLDQPGQDVLGQAFHEIYPPALADRWLALLEQVRQTRQAVNLREFHIFQDGLDCYFDVDMVPMPAEHDQGEGILTIRREVTREVIARKRVEELVSQLQFARNEADRRAAELNAIFDAMIEPVIMFDRHGEPRQANPAARLICGFDPTALDGRTFFDRLNCRHNDGRPMSLAEMPATLASQGASVAADYTIVDAQGQDRTIHSNATPLITNNQISGAVAVWHDVTERQGLLRELERARDELEHRVHERTLDLARTVETLQQEVLERRRAEESLRESQQYLHRVITGVPVILWAIDRQGVFTLSEGKGLAGLGLAPGQLVGTSMEDFCARTPAVLEQIRLALGGKDVEVELPSDQRVFDSRFSPIFDTAGQVVGIIGVSVDITDRKQLEQDVLDIGDQERSRIGRDLHDALGQTLTGLSFLSKVLERKLSMKNLPEENDAHEITGLCTQAVSQTRSLARGLCPVELKAEGLMTALHELANRSASMLGLACRFRCSGTVLVNDNATAEQLYHIAQEAVSNAAKHGKAKTITVTLDEARGRISLSVRDDGVGLPTAEHRPTGMGLKIMDYRARVIGGRLEIRRMPRGGTLVRCLVQRK